MNEVFASYIDILISYSDKFLTILPISFVALIGSFYLLFKSIGDIKNREQYSKFQLISSSGTFILNVVAFAIGIIGLILENENTQFKLFISEILIISASFVLLILCFISIISRCE